MASTKSDLLYAGGLILWEIVLLAVVFGLAAFLKSSGMLMAYYGCIALICVWSVRQCFPLFKWFVCLVRILRRSND